ncbi:hypothetical protein Tco_0665138 [Tanacetum coccineum]
MKQDGNKKDQSCYYGILQDVGDNEDLVSTIFKICPRVQGQDFDALPTDEEIVSLLRELEVYLERQLVLTSFVSPEHKSFRIFPTKETTQIYGAILPKSLTSPEMKETKAYKTYLGYVTGATPPKKARKIKKPASPQLTTIPVLPEEPTRKSKRVKRPAKKSTKVPARGVVIRETPEMSLSKKKEKVDVTRGKGIELLSEVALTEDAQYEEVRQKSLRDFHKTHPSGFGAVKIIPFVTSEGTGVKPGVPDVIEEESSESEAESWGNDEDDSNNDNNSESDGIDEENESDDDKALSDNEKGSDSEHETDENKLNSESNQEENEEEKGDDEEEKEDEFVETPSNDSDDEDETNITDKAKGDNDEEMDYTTSQLYDDVDIRLNEPVDIDEGFIQEEGTDAEMTNIQQGNENPEISQVIKDAHVTLSIIPQKTEVLVTSSSHSSDLASKFLNFSDIPHMMQKLAAKFLNFADIPTIDAEIVSSMDVHVHHELPSNQTPTLHTIPILVITNSSPVYSIVIPQSLPSFTPPPPQSTPTPPPIMSRKVSALEREVAELKKDDLLNTQVTALVDEHLDSRLGATRDEFMSYLPESITARITEQVKIQIPHILPNEVSNFAPSVIKSKVIESLEHVVIAKESSQPQSIYKATTLLIEFELKKILIYKMDESQSYLTATEHKECYDVLIKSYDLDKSLLSIYDKSVHAEEPEFEVVDSDMPQDQEENLGTDDEEPM